MNVIIRLCFLVFLAQTAVAQTFKPANRYYIGASFLYQNKYEVFYPSSTNWASIGPWQVVAGTRLPSNLALQVGYSYYRQQENKDPYFIGTTATGDPASGSRRSLITAQAVPALLRYELLRNRQLGLQALAGLTLWYSTSELEEINKVANQVVSVRNVNESAWQLFGSVGLGASFRFSQRIEAIGDLTWNKNFNPAPAYVHLAATGNRLGITTALSLGLRYHFNLGKKPADSAAPVEENP